MDTLLLQAQLCTLDGVCSSPGIYLLIPEPQWCLFTLILSAAKRERNCHILVVTACNPLSPESKALPEG